MVKCKHFIEKNVKVCYNVYITVNMPKWQSKKNNQNLIKEDFHGKTGKGNDRSDNQKGNGGNWPGYRNHFNSGRIQTYQQHRCSTSECDTVCKFFTNAHDGHTLRMHRPV